MPRNNGVVLGLSANGGAGDLDLANHTASGIWQKAIQSGVIARLAGQTPEIKVGNTDFFTFTGTPKAELVGESAQKSNTGEAPLKVTAKTYKVQVTHRMSEEVMYADEDYQLQLVDGLVARVGTALSRAIDLVAIHGINPLTGNAASVDQYLTKSGNGVEKIDFTNANADMLLAISELAGNGYSPTGAGFDPSFSVQLAQTPYSPSDSRQLYPEMGFGTNAKDWRGLQVAVGDTVSAKHEVAGGTGVKAVIGDFANSFKWGIARNVPIQTILYGDPDGNGDLKRHNEIAIRAEAIFGFAFLENGAGFAVIGDGFFQSN